MNQQSGVALISAVIVSTLVSLIAVQFFERSETSLRRIGTVIYADEAIQTVLSMETLAIAALTDDAKSDRQNKKIIDHLDEIWAQKVPRVPANNGFVKGQMIDINSRINVNNLTLTNAQLDEQTQQIDPYNKILLTRLSESLEIEIGWIDALIDWIDEDSVPIGNNGAEDATYTSYPIAYRTPNRAIVDIEELILIDGIDEKLLSKIRPHVIAADAVIKINVNTASAQVIASLSPEFDEKIVQSILSRRSSSSFRSVSDFLDVAAKAANVSRNKLLIEGNQIGVSSSHFRVEGTVWLDDQVLSIVSYLYRDDNGVVRVLWRKLLA